MKHIGNLTIPKGSRKKRKRIGRGQGSGFGGTSTKGHKGQKSRSGFGQFRGFEGGQMPLNRRVPKFGFYNRNRIEYNILNVGDLQSLADNGKISGKVDYQSLLELGLINKNKPLKILGDGELTTKLDVHAHRFTGSAKQKIESAGGTVNTDG